VLAGRSWRSFDWLLIIVTVLICTIGVISIYSATFSVETGDKLASRLFFRQTTFIISGMVLCFLAAAVDYQLLGEAHRLLYALTLGLLGFVELRGQLGFGAQSWLGSNAGIQPSELSKILLIVFLARFMSEHIEEETSSRWILLSGVLLVPPVLLIYIQPDLGTALVVVAIWIGMAFAAGIRWTYVLALGVAGAAAVPAVWLSMRGYMRDRVMTFVNSILRPSGPEAILDYNTRQALTSIGSGGLFGKGFLNGTQSQLYFLRVRHTDYVFSVFSEEFGFLGATVLLLLLTVLLWRILSVASHARDSFGQLVACGVATMIFVQAFVNIAVNLGMLPVTGLTLPLVSYGGSSVWATLLGIGLVESVSLRHRPLEFAD